MATPQGKKGMSHGKPLLPEDQMAGIVASMLGFEGYTTQQVIRIATVILAIEGKTEGKKLIELTQNVESVYNQITDEFIELNKKAAQSITTPGSKKIH